MGVDLQYFSSINHALVPDVAGLFYVNKFQVNFEKGGKASKMTMIKYVAT